MNWIKVKLGDLIRESRIPASNPNPNKRIRVRLNVLGVEKRPLENEIEGATKQFERKAGQFIYGKQNFHKGAFGIIPQELDGFETSADIPSFDVREDCLVEWIFYYFKIGNKYLELEKLARGVGSKRIHPEQISQIEIPLPELSEQRIIIKLFKEIEFKGSIISSELNNQLDLVKQLRQAFLREAMQGKLVPQMPETEGNAQDLLAQIKAEKAKLIKEKKLKGGKSTYQSINYTENHNIPNNWIWCKADDIFFITKLAGFEYTEYFSLKSSGDIPVIRAQNVRKLRIDKSNLLFIDKETSFRLDRCALNKKCLLVTFIGAGIGDVATFNESNRWHLAPNVAKMEPFNGCEDLISVEFINYFLLSDTGQKEIFKHLKATAQPSLSMSTIRDIDIPLPPILEQKRIVQKLESLMQLCDNLEESIKQSNTQNEMLLQQVLREALSPKEVENV